MTEAEPNWSEVKRLVADALELPSDARTAFLRARCVDASIHAEAIRLLRSSERAAASPVLAESAARLAGPVMIEVDEKARGVPEALRAELAGRYTIDREIGRGGMATVFLAHDERHGRQVALKLLRPELLVPEDGPTRGATRFEREIEFAARLSHPHILALHDSGAVAGMLYYITPYVEGDSLRERVARDGRLPLPDTLRILRDVARALAYAHRQGVVHRDIKPANILLNEDGDALVADFGVAKGLAAAQGHRASAEDELTDETLVLGTPAYMAPEQVTGAPEIDHRADLYALGALAYELLTGAAPFAGRTRHEQLTAHLSEVPPSASAVRPDVPPALGALVDRLLEKRPEDRPEDAGVVLSLLDAVLVEPSAGGGLLVRTAPLGPVRGYLKLLPGLGVLALLSSSGPTGGAPAPASEVRQIPSIAVLPFATPGGSLDDAAFGQGLSDDLIRALEQVTWLRVAAPTSAAALGRRNLDARGIGDLLGVEAVVQGSVRRNAGRLGVSASLVLAADGRVRWSDRYDVPAQDLFELQERLVRDVTAALAPGMTAEARDGSPEARESGDTEDPLAYELYQKGRYLVGTRQRDGLQRGLEYLEAAIARDSGYARAHAAIADAWTFRGLFGHAPPHEAFPRARTAAVRAVELDSLLVEGHAVLAHLRFIYEWDWEGAEPDLERAISLDPRYPLLRIYYASFLHSVGRSEEALEQLTIAREIDPLTPTGIFRGRVYIDTGRPAEAIRVLEEVIDLEPRLDLAHQFLSHAYLQDGRVGRAIESMRRAAALSGARDSAQLAYVYAMSGETVEARRVLSRVLGGDRPTNLFGFHLAMAYGALGERNEAFRWLETAYEERAGFMNLLAVATGFEPLRRDPRFEVILSRMGLR